MKIIIAVALAVVASAFLIPANAMAWSGPYFDVTHSYAGGYGYHGFGCGLAACSSPPVVVSYPVPVAVPVPVPVTSPCCGCSCGGGIGGAGWIPPIATPYNGPGPDSGIAYAQPYGGNIGQSTTQVNNVYDSPGSYVSNYASNVASQGGYGGFGYDNW